MKIVIFFQEWRLCLRAKSSTASRKSTGFRECCSRCRFSSSTPSIGGRISIKRRRSLGPTSIRSSSDALPASRASDQFYLQLLHFFFLSSPAGSILQPTTCVLSSLMLAHFHSFGCFCLQPAPCVVERIPFLLLSSVVVYSFN